MADEKMDMYVSLFNLKKMNLNFFNDIFVYKNIKIIGYVS